MPKYRLIQTPTRNPNVYQADEKDLETLKTLQNEPRVPLYMERHQCEDYYYDRATQTMHYPVKTISINMTQFHLTPGKNEVPKSVYEFWLQCQDDKNKGYTPYGSTDVIKQQARRGGLGTI